MKKTLGAFILGEPLTRLQWLATAVAAIGVSIEVFAVGYVPWIALVLATSFAVYGLLRRQIAVPAAIRSPMRTFNPNKLPGTKGIRSSFKMDMQNGCSCKNQIHTQNYDLSL